MSAFVLSCLAYLGVALPGSTIGLLWPSARLSFGQPIGTLGILLVLGITTEVLANAATGRLLSRVRMGPLIAFGVISTGSALLLEALAPSLWVFAAGMVVFGLGFGVMDAALNAHAASHFGARGINWMHASYGLGATIGPLLVTALLNGGLSWRWAFGVMALVQATLAVVALLARDAWRVTSRPPSHAPGPRSPDRQRPGAVAVIALTFAAVETGIESAAGIWGYVFLTTARGMSGVVAGAAVSAYWAMMFVGRVAFGPVAERLGSVRVLGAAVAGVTGGAALMAVPGTGLVAVIGLMVVGLAAAPIFPLLAHTTAARATAAGSGASAQNVSLQVAASGIGSAALPAGLGVAIGAWGGWVLAPLLSALGMTMCGAYAFLARRG